MKKKLTSIQGVEEDCKMDSSSMIDMVFQLILFFMVSSRMLTNQIDPRVELPVAGMRVRRKRPPGASSSTSMTTAPSARTTRSPCRTWRR
jgi:biopolymer transport protein ExbD